VENLVKTVLAQTSIWGEDLNAIPGLKDRVVYYINRINEVGMLDTVKELLDSDK
jgi:tagaturonate reductase